MKASVDVADLIGLNLVMSRNAGKGEYKIMVAALGWATAELIMSRCVQQPGAQTPKKGVSVNPKLQIYPSTTPSTVVIMFVLS